MTKTQFVSPRMRMVQGNAFEPNTTDQQNQPLFVKTGPNKGQPRKEWVIACAISKTDPAAMPFLLSLKAAAVAAWPNFFPGGGNDVAPTFGCTHPRFSIKIIDGDGTDDNGKANATKEGFAGHWVVRFKTGFAPPVYEAGKYDPMQNVANLPNKDAFLKRGYFVRVAGSFESNDNADRPGMYVNLQMIEIAGVGPEIVSGPDAATVFGGGAPSPAPTPPAAVAPPPAPPAPPAPPPPPNDAFMKAGPQMLPAAQGATYEQMKAAGWTDELLVQHGMMLPLA